MANERIYGNLICFDFAIECRCNLSFTDQVLYIRKNLPTHLVFNELLPWRLRPHGI